ncbi:MAG: hypothetical protein PHT69_10685 [Bacteroidales bacterium]|nr:hypothetical protein [Bacteroidales bacterium]
MKIILLFASFVLTSCISPQKPELLAFNSTTSDTSECSNLYPFQGYYVNLDDNNAVLIDGIPSKDFKNCSKYAHRFSEIISDSVSMNGYSFSLEIKNEANIFVMHIYQGQDILKTIELPVENPLPDVHGYNASLIPYNNDVIVLLEDMYTTHYLICKYNTNGEELLRKEIEHTFITHPEENTNYYHRYLYFYNITTTQMIFTSHFGFTERTKTIVLSMDDFAISEFGMTAKGLILDCNEENLTGIVSQDQDTFTLNLLPYSFYEFEIENASPACELILKDSLLYIANYHPIATGSELYCFDLHHNKIKWKADVEQLMVEHSKYYNKVTLSMYKNKIIMEGNEAGGNYLQIFDTETGTRLASFGNFEETEE